MQYLRSCLFNVHWYLQQEKKSDAERIHEEVERQVSKCCCTKQYAIQKVSDNKYVVSIDEVLKFSNSSDQSVLSWISSYLRPIKSMGTHTHSTQSLTWNASMLAQCHIIISPMALPAYSSSWYNVVIIQRYEILGFYPWSEIPALFINVLL